MEPLPEAVREFVAAARVCRIASVRPDGTPHVIPVCPVFVGDATLYVDLASHGVSAAAFRSNPSITVLIDEYHDDWSKLQAVILRCRAEELAGEEMERAWAMIREKFPQYVTVDWQPRLTLALRIDGWTEWGLAVPLSSAIQKSPLSDIES
ncbi:MAG TPA: pyridoxamine 5'-phosphate oxidase family protein, partial [Dehalococcoidia bacterium]|nr:pyridoxamine 5'-phosphate oxidase family protein [Dehalococcoidia bacterium]